MFMAVATKRILIADDDDDLRESICKLLVEEGNGIFEIIEARNGHTTLEAVLHVEESLRPDLILLDYEFPDMDGLAILQEINHSGLHIPVIMMSGYKKSSNLVMKTATFNSEKYLYKPFSNQELLDTIHAVLKAHFQPASDIYDLPTIDPSDYLVGVSKQMLNIYTEIPKIAKSKECVNLQGETGTGKTYLAELIHRFSDRRKMPFKEATCTTITETIADSLLFGSVKGAFTGAVNSMGWFESANHGTLFLDEIAELPLGTQAKLFRAVEDKKVTRVGENNSISTDVRLIVATNQDLQAMANMGTFRPELFYRITVVNLHIPSLRERKEDIPYLVAYFLMKIPQNFSDSLKITKPAMNTLMEYDWPGNIRQLENKLRGIISRLRGNIITEDMLDLQNNTMDIRRTIPEMVYMNASYSDIVLESKRQVLQAALTQNLGSISNAAENLGLSKREFQHECNEVGIILKK